MHVIGIAIHSGAVVQLVGKLEEHLFHGEEVEEAAGRVAVGGEQAGGGDGALISPRNAADVQVRQSCAHGSSRSKFLL